MKNLKRVLCALLALVMVLGFVGCKNNGDDKNTPAPNNTNKPAESEVPATAVPNTPLPTGDYNAMSAAIYDAQLGAFNTLYQAAKEEQNVSKRYALMAQAEAKLLEAAVLIPGTTNGGKPIMHLSRLGEVCQRYKIKIGIITVPAEYAQGVCDLLIENGILAIWNFAPKHLNVPDGILVQNENMAASLALLCKHLNERMQGQDG